MSEKNNLMDGGFYTLKGYAMNKDDGITSAMEDYLEMIYRLYSGERSVRIKELSEILHVKPPSASKMANILKKEKLIEFEKYGRITLTDEGKALGEYLLFRHNILNSFFCIINRSEDELALVEKIEHFINRETVANMQRWIEENENL